MQIFVFKKLYSLKPTTFKKTLNQLVITYNQLVITHVLMLGYVCLLEEHLHISIII